MSTKDKSRLKQCGTEALPGIFFGYALSSGGGWTGDLTIADCRDIENNVAAEQVQRILIEQEQEAFLFYSEEIVP